MLITTKSKTINGGSWVKQDGREIQVASMVASVDSRGNQNFNNSIVNQTLYQSNKEVVDNDITEFKQMVANLEWEES